MNNRIEAAVSELAEAIFEQVVAKQETSAEKSVRLERWTDEEKPEKKSSWCDMVLTAYGSGASSYPSGGSRQDSPFSEDGMLHIAKAPLHEWPSWDLPLYYAHDKQPEQEAPADDAEDFADVMRNGLGAIVAWFNEDAGNTEPDPEENEDPVECYALNVVADVYRDGHAELEVFSEDDVYLGELELTADEVCKLFND